MTSHPPSKCCVVGVKHEGEPTGKLVKVSGKWDAYLARPPPEKSHGNDVAILYIPDAMGIWQNSKLMADQYAANGYLTFIVDIFNGDPIPLNKPGNFEFDDWMLKGSSGDNPHTTETVDPIVKAAIEHLRNEFGVKKLGGVGYCFGAKYLCRHFKAGKIDVGFMAHPTFVSEDELAGVSGPLSIAAAETDHVFPSEMRHRSEEILKETALPYQINLYSGVAHGFAVRCDPSRKTERYCKEAAFFQAVQWFDAWLF